MERTLVIAKPDAVQRGLIGEIVSRLERRGLKVVAMRMLRLSPELAAEHYAIHRGKPFYEGLIRYITSAPVVAVVVEGPQAIEVVRQTMGATHPAEATPGTIRADFALEIGRNLVHGADSPENAAREIALFFSSEEILSYTREVDRWILE